MVVREHPEKFLYRNSLAKMPAWRFGHVSNLMYNSTIRGILPESAESVKKKCRLFMENDEILIIKIDHREPLELK